MRERVRLSNTMPFCITKYFTLVVSLLATLAGLGGRLLYRLFGDGVEWGRGIYNRRTPYFTYFLL